MARPDLSEIWVIFNSSIISSNVLASLFTGKVISLSPNDLYLYHFLKSKDLQLVYFDLLYNSKYQFQSNLKEGVF